MIRPVLVLGAGLAGLAVSLRLEKLGFQVCLIERRAEARFTDQPDILHRIADETVQQLGIAPRKGGLYLLNELRSALMQKVSVRQIDYSDATRLEHVDWHNREAHLSSRVLPFSAIIDASGVSRISLRHLPDDCQAIIRGVPQSSQTLNISLQSIAGASVQAAQCFQENGLSFALMSTKDRACLTVFSEHKSLLGTPGETNELIETASNHTGLSLGLHPETEISRYAFREMTQYSLSTETPLPFIAIGDALLQTNPVHADGLKLLMRQLDIVEEYHTKHGFCEIMGRLTDEMANVFESFIFANALRQLAS